MGLWSRAVLTGCRYWARAAVMERQWPEVLPSGWRESLQPSLLLEAGDVGGISYFVRIESCFQKSREFIWPVFNTYLNVVPQLDLVSRESLVTFRRLPERQTLAKTSSEKMQLAEKWFPSSCESKAKKEGKNKWKCVYSPCSAKREHLPA